MDQGETVVCGSRFSAAEESFNGALYEFMIFEEILSKQALLGLDSYVKKKYSQYPFGRPNKIYS
jgi:hypothetical protein